MKQLQTTTARSCASLPYLLGLAHGGKANINSLRILVLAQTILGAASIQASPASVPQEFAVYVGGAFGYASVKLQNGAILCSDRRSGNLNKNIATHPTTEAWVKFRARLDRINVWRWQPSYPNPFVRDGTRWRIRITYEDANVTSEGSNSFPDSEGRPDESWEETVPFKNFLSSVSELTKGCKL